MEYRFLSCGGFSNNTGFRVLATWWLKDGSHRSYKACTERYDRRRDTKLRTLVERRIGRHVALAIFIGGHTLFWWLSLFVFHTPLLMTVFAGVLLLFFSGIGAAETISFLFIFWYDLETRTWHGCEHMTIELIEEHRPLTLRELKKCNRVSPCCGTRSSAFALLPSFAILQAFAGLSIGGELGVALAISSLVYFYAPAPLSIYLSQPIQFFITTAEPSERQLRSGLKLAEEIREVEQRYFLTSP